MRYIFFTFLIFIASCQKTITPNNISLNKQLEEIVNFSENVECINQNEWRFTEIGSKACGGPTGYIAYSSKIDTVAFLKKVKEYTASQKQYNIDNQVISDCSLAPVPIGIKCENKKPILVY